MRDQPAGFVSRLVAFVIDLLILSTIGALVAVSVTSILNFFNLDFLAAPPSASETDLVRIARLILVIAGTTFGFLLINGYPVVFWLLTGQTPGKSFLGLRVVAVDGRPISVRRALRRLVGYWISAIPLFAGFLWVLIDDERRAWHDRLAATRVVYAWEARMGQRIMEAMRERRRQLRVDDDRSG
jgi:uncharacterized RDD family membrane protein YckC